MSTTLLEPPAAPSGSAKPLTTGKQPIGILIALWLFVTIPFVAMIAAVPAMWGWGLNWVDVVLFVVFYLVGGFGIGVGFHRHFTHGSFKAKRWLRITLAVAGCLAIEGAPTQWVADHRRHHQFSDMEGDPHSPWRYGESVWGLTKGLWYSHTGWLFYREMSNQARFAPDLVADKDIRLIDKLFPWLVVDLGGPARGHRWSRHLVVAGRVVGAVLGEPGPDRAAPPHHLVDQLGVPRVRRAPVRQPRQGHQLLAAGDPVLR